MAGNDLQGTAGKPSLFRRLKDAAHRLKVETYALYLAYRDPRTPWYAKAWALFVVAHTFSPIDLIPDFIPVLGYLDDLIITPLGIWLALKMIPAEVMAESRKNAAQVAGSENRLGRWGMLVIVIIWLAILAAAGFLVFRLIQC
ncbi:MAG: DUF1232 domain-containing protein [Chloroflexi bacterium]|nr:DUF1232 domain-containing protein [Chloroflexota bacterium]